MNVMVRGQCIHCQIAKQIRLSFSACIYLAGFIGLRQIDERSGMSLSEGGDWRRLIKESADPQSAVGSGIGRASAREIARFSYSEISWFGCVDACWVDADDVR